ncbi:MAG: hypothetical protein ABI232_00670 [Jatrophihabitantaceae bacterium]
MSSPITVQPETLITLAGNIAQALDPLLAQAADVEGAAFRHCRVRDRPGMRGER